MTITIFAGGNRLNGWTDVSVTRSRSSLTGEARITVFLDWLPETPPLGNTYGGTDIAIYTGAHLFFTGTVSRRNDSAFAEPATTSTISKNTFRTSITCRGVAATLVDSAQPTITDSLSNTTASNIARIMLEPYGIALDWRATDATIPIWRFRIGARIVDELQRLSEYTGLYFRESERGTVIAEDGTIPSGFGADLVLGSNIMQMDVSDNMDAERQVVSAVGQRTVPELWGKSAILNNIISAADSTVNGNTVAVVQLYGDATAEALDRRVKYEMARRASAGRRVSVTVFGVTQPDGSPWQVGARHMLHAPQAGVSGLFEAESVTVSASAKGNYQTTIELVPPGFARSESLGAKSSTSDQGGDSDGGGGDGADGKKRPSEKVDPQIIESILHYLRARVTNQPWFNAPPDTTIPEQ